MKIVKQPNRWSCGAASVSMVTGIPLKSLIKQIGHDGSEILFPDKPEPLNRRSFVIDEFQDVLITYWMALVPINGRPLIENIDVFKDPESRLDGYLKNYSGILEGCYAPDKPHIVAYSGGNADMFGKIYNPSDGKITDLENSGFAIQTFWILKELR